jgi:putative FmdB family regulatory protein
MPIYEYECANCHATFEKLRPMSQANAPAACSQCGSTDTSRAISLFSAISKGGNGDSRAVSGTGGGCATCGTHNCGSCGH